MPRTKSSQCLIHGGFTRSCIQDVADGLHKRLVERVLGI
jgi:hypothetical protein